MTEKEFQQVRREMAERKARTSFPGEPNPRELYEAHGGHAEHGSSKH